MLFRWLVVLFLQTSDNYQNTDTSVFAPSPGITLVVLPFWANTNKIEIQILQPQSPRVHCSAHTHCHLGKAWACNNFNTGKCRKLLTEHLVDWSDGRTAGTTKQMIHLFHRRHFVVAWKAQMLTRLIRSTMALFFSNIPVTHDGVTVSQQPNAAKVHTLYILLFTSVDLQCRCQLALYITFNKSLEILKQISMQHRNIKTRSFWWGTFFLL